MKQKLRNTKSRNEKHPAMVLLGEWLTSFTNLGQIECNHYDLLKNGLALLDISLPFSSDKVDVIFPRFFPIKGSHTKEPINKNLKKRLLIKELIGKIECEITSDKTPQGKRSYYRSVKIQDDNFCELLNKYLNINPHQQIDYSEYYKYIIKMASLILTADNIKILSNHLINCGLEWVSVFSELDNNEFDLENLKINPLKTNDFSVLCSYKRLRLASQHEIPLTNDPDGNLFSQELSSVLLINFPDEGLGQKDYVFQILWETIAAKIFFKYLELGGQKYITFCRWCGAFVCMDYKGKRKYCYGNKKYTSTCNTLMNKYKRDHPEYREGG